LDAWQKSIEVLDKPLRQVEVEAQMLKLTPQALKYLQVTSEVLGPHDLGRDASAKISELIKSKQAQISSAPRVACISGLTAALVSTASVPARLVPVASVGSAADPSWNTLVPSDRVWVETSIGMAVRPTLLPDGAIDMEMALGRSLQVQITPGAARLRPAQQVSFQARDGRSYLLFAHPDFTSPTPLIGAEPANPLAPTLLKPITSAQPDAEGKIAVFIVRASIVKRFDDQDEAKVQELIQQGRVEAAR